MNLLWISLQTPGYLGIGGLRVDCIAPSRAPSLVALVRERKHGKPCDAIVIDCRETELYSPAHILSAAQLLRDGDVWLLLLASQPLADMLPPQQPGSRLVTVTGGDRDAVRALEASMEAERQRIREQAAVTKRKDSAAPEKAERGAPRPMAIRRDCTLLIAVVGSQSRIGCTTQAFSLYHYFRALGFTPAIVTTQAAITLFTRLNGAGECPGGCLLGEIPLVCRADVPGYNCYVLDLGVLDGEKLPALRDADWRVLVCGGKTWEIGHTARAARLLAGLPRVLFLASFTRPAELRQLRAITGAYPASAVPWQPDPFAPPDYAVYERLLRPSLSEALGERPEQERSIP